MRQFLAITLILLLFISQLGYYFYYASEITGARSEMNVRINGQFPETTSQLVSLEDNAGAIIWEECGKEFYLKGVLYDVVKKEKRNGKTLLYCLADTKEESLLKDRSKAVSLATGNANDNRSGKPIYKFQISDYLMIVTGKPVPSSSLLCRAYLDYDAALVCSIREVNFPPPRA